MSEVLYLGGEPTLCPHLGELLRAGGAGGIRQRLVTNGQRVTPNLARRFSEIGVEVGVSFSSSSADKHDRLVRRKGAFDRTLAFIDFLASAAVPTFIHYSPTMLSPPGDFERLVELLEARAGHRFVSFEVNRLLPIGEAADDGRALLVREDTWWDVLRQVGRVAESGRVVHVESVPRCWVRRCAAADGLPAATLKAILAAIRPCRMAIVQLALDPWGRIKLCPGAPPTATYLLAANPVAAWLLAPELVAYRRMEWLPAQCVDYGAGRLCPEFNECAGGCRHARGDRVSHDPLTCASGS